MNSSHKGRLDLETGFSGGKFRKIVSEAVMIGIFIALISGALMSIQGVFNTEVTKNTSIWVSSSWVQFSALLVCLAAWLFTGR